LTCDGIVSTVEKNRDRKEGSMRKLFAAMGGAAIASLALSAAHAQGTVKIGLVLPLSGQFADTGIQMRNGIHTYIKQYGDMAGGKKIELVIKDTGGINPPVAKRLSQELVVRDKVDVLAGYVLTPNALAAADVSKEANKFMVVMNAATAIITERSDRMIRTSMTLPQAGDTLGTWAFTKGGIKSCYTMVSDYGPGHDVEQSFVKAFTAAGGKIIGSVRYPVANPDFAAFVQRAKDLNPECVMIFVPGGTQPAAIAKALSERGLDPQKIKVLGTGELTGEQALEGMGKSSLGIITAWHYDYKQDTKENKEFVKIHNELFKRNPDLFSLGGYDGMHAIYEVLKKTKGNTDGTAMVEAAKGLKWASPRGPMWIDPRTRDVVQTIYIRRVEMVNGQPTNVIFDKVENVKDPVKEEMLKKK
jgi:branched-chain amino acid transport system substrate-binding protein